MMISTQTIRMCSPGMIPQPGIGIKSSVPVVLDSSWRRRRGLQWSSCFQKGRGCSTLQLAIKQASSFFSSAEDTSDDEVPAKDTVVMSDLTGTKTVELEDPISPAQLASTVDDQLPSLLSMVIDGLPPLQQSEYIHEAENLLQQYVERYPTVSSSLASYCRLGLSAASYAHPGVISLDRIVAISINYGLLFLLDDLFFDIRDEFLRDQYGISRGTCGNPENNEEYLEHLVAVLSQQVQPRNPTPLLETMMCESGRNMLELSNPEWFTNYVKCVMDFRRTSVAIVDIVQGHNLYFQDLESFTVMRAANVAGKLTQVMIEFANDSYIPGVLSADPYFENITTAVSIHIAFVNDLYSYHKESKIEQNPRNLITVLMECEGKSFVQAVHMAIGLANTYARALLDLEAEASSSTLRNYLQGIKAVVAGNLYFGLADMRYHHPDSAFPELRDMTSSWKIVPHAKDGCWPCSPRPSCTRLCSLQKRNSLCLGYKIWLIGGILIIGGFYIVIYGQQMERRRRNALALICGTEPPGLDDRRVITKQSD